MPSWKKVALSGSDASFNSLDVTTSVTAASFTGSFSGSVAAPGATTQVVYNNGGTLFADSGLVYSGSRLGIGTTTPQKPLEAISNGNDFVSVGVASIAVGQWTGIHFGYRESNNFYRKSAIVFERTDLTANNAQGKIHILNGPQGDANNATLADARLTITENGNVGIGTTVPTQALDINGNIRVRSLTTSAGDFVTADSNGVFSRRTPAQVLSDIGAQAALTNPVTGTGTSGQVSFWNGTTTQTGDNGLWWDNTNKRLGIGTTTPSTKLHVAGVTRSQSFINDNDRIIFAPEGASYNTSTSSVTGAFKIKLPTTRFNSETMLMMTINIYNYSTGTSLQFKVGGYNFSLGYWMNVFAQQVSDSNVNIFNVRFGNDGTSNCIWIGETNTNWSYPQVFITDFQAGYRGLSSSWTSGWSITPVTSFDTVDITRATSTTITTNNISTRIGTGASGQVSFWNGTTTQTGDNGLFWDNTNKRLGIGTTSPDRRLSVLSSGAGVEAARFTDGNNADLVIGFPSSGVSMITSEFGTAGILAFGSGTGRNERMRITAGGNLLVGTTADGGEKLQVSGNTRTDGTLGLRASATSSTATQFPVFTADPSSTTRTLVTRTPAQVLRDIGATPRFVGSISGVSNAGYTNVCNVVGDSLASSVLMTFQGTTGNVVVNTTAQIIVNHSQDIYIRSESGGYTLLTIRVISNGDENFTVQVTTNSPNAVTLNVEVFPQNSESVEFSPSVINTGETLTHLAYPGMVVSATGGSNGDLRVLGNTSIGTNTSNSRLQIQGSGTTSATSTLNATNSSGTSLLFVRDDGNVGIGTTSPDSLLNVYTPSGGTNISATHGVSGAYPKASGISFGATSTSLSVSNNGGTTVFTGGAGIYANNSASSNNPTDLIFWTTAGGSPAERMRITAGGNVGIGTTTPSLTASGRTVVSINGSSSSLLEFKTGDNWNAYILRGGNLELYDRAEILFSTNGSIRQFISSNGTVGIGTTSPAANLDVFGVANTSGTSSLLLRSGNSSSNFNSNQITFGFSNSATYRHAIKTRHNSVANVGNAIDFYTWGSSQGLNDIGSNYVMSMDGQNVSLFNTGSFGGGVKVMYIANATTEPTTAPSGGGILYVWNGALKYRGSNGTETVIAPA